MNPAELRKLLATHADGELDPATRAELETRLADDPGAQAELQRWQDLRRAAQHALNSEAPPAGLEARIRANLRSTPRIHHRRFFRLGLSGLGAVAAVLAAFFLWPQGAEATTVTTGELAEIHRMCALSHRHDSFNVRGESPGPALATIERKAPFPCRMLNVAAAGGLQLDGACACAPCRAVRAVHAYFRTKEAPDVVISAFAVDRPVRMCNCQGKPCACCRSQRRYTVGHDGDLTVLGWQGGCGAYVLVARTDEATLRKIADELCVQRQK